MWENKSVYNEKKEKNMALGLLVLGFPTLMLNDNKFALFTVTALVALVYHFNSSIKLIEMISLELCSDKNTQINKTENYTDHYVCYFPCIQVFLKAVHGNYAYFPAGDEEAIYARVTCMFSNNW